MNTKRFLPKSDSILGEPVIASELPPLETLPPLVLLFVPPLLLKFGTIKVSLNFKVSYFYRVLVSLVAVNNK